MLKRNLPVALLDMINNETWAGKGCMVLGSMVTKPSAAEVAENYVFLKPMVMYSPKKACIILGKTTTVDFGFLFLVEKCCSFGLKRKC